MKFTKMHGLGNDFILPDPSEYLTEEELPKAARALCDRRLGVGADGLLLVCPSREADIRMRIINADGSEAEMCGNGIRCFAKYVYDHSIVPREEMTIQTLAGIMKPTLSIREGQVVAVRVDMGYPRFAAQEIPVRAEDPQHFFIPLDEGEVEAASVLMGVPHTMVFTHDLSEQNVVRLGAQIERHTLFPQKTNVNFVRVEDEKTLSIRTFERGAGLTLACGTGSCASAVAAYKKGLCGSRITVKNAVGELLIEIAADDKVYMSGPAKTVFCGQTDLGGF